MQLVLLRPLAADTAHKYGSFRLQNWSLSEKLYPHLWEIQETATARMEQMMANLLKANPAPDKKLNQMAWVQHMNMLKAQAEEVILTELINS